ncbi:hypothetical protein [Paenibacillus tundrae]|uniref:hypothetical protein n=1 Tax=Paenibacillus tundrae TaxID=528187 RepID=UPI0030CBC81D
MNSISYQRESALYRALLAFVFIPVSITLLYATFTDDFILNQYYYGSAALLGFWYFGPIWITLGLRAMAKDTLIVQWDESNIFLRNGRPIPWSTVTRIELKMPFLRRWAQPAQPFYRLHLYHNQFEDIQTGYVFTPIELKRNLGVLRKNWHLYKNRK